MMNVEIWDKEKDENLKNINLGVVPRVGELINLNSSSDFKVIEVCYLLNETPPKVMVVVESVPN